MWQKEYKKEKFYWGTKPLPDLKEIIKISPRGIALDIGAGEGRNSIFLAKNGFEVEAIDKVREGLEKCQKLAEKYNLPIKTKVVDVKKFKFEENKYSLILSVNALDFLKLKEIKKLLKKIKYSLLGRGFFYLTVFTREDPLCKKYIKERVKMPERYTFFIYNFKTYHHFFEKEELLNLLKDFEVLKIEEKRIKEKHGGKTHFHHLIRIICKKNKGSK